MVPSKYSIVIALFGLVSCFISSTNAETSELWIQRVLEQFKWILFIFINSFLTIDYFSPLFKDCDPTTCTGPLYYYEELGCLPIYDNSSSCCARKYNCDHWKVLPDSKCYVNGRVYESGEVFPPQVIGGGCTRCICAGSVLNISLV